MNKPIPVDVGQRHGSLVIVSEECGYRNEKGRKLRMFHVHCDCGADLLMAPSDFERRTRCSQDCAAQIGASMPDELPGEVWVSIPETKGLYLVSNKGRIWSFRKKSCMKPQQHPNGYWFVYLRINNKSIYFSVHRLVARFFVENPNNYAEVNHKDENKGNNCADNLEWCTRKYNCNYGERNTPISRRVVQCDAYGNDVIEYKSACEAMRQTGINQADITRCCQGKRKSAKGTYWRYKE